jgi:hypothetical protein
MNGKTVIEQILDNAAKNMDADGHAAAQPICIVCGDKASFEGHGFGQQKLFVCPRHKALVQRVGGYREIHTGEF